MTLLLGICLEEVQENGKTVYRIYDAHGELYSNTNRDFVAAEWRKLETLLHTAWQAATVEMGRAPDFMELQKIHIQVRTEYLNLSASPSFPSS